MTASDWHSIGLGAFMGLAISVLTIGYGWVFSDHLILGCVLFVLSVFCLGLYGITR